MRIFTNTTIYIDSAGTEETRTIMRAELVAMHTAHTTFAMNGWISIFTDSLSSLEAFWRHRTNPGTTSAKHYHHHNLMLGSNTGLLETRRLAYVSITLHKVKAHANIRGNDLADAAVKPAVTHYETLPPPQTQRDEIEEIAPRLSHWVMYSVKPPPPIPALSTGTNCTTLHRPCMVDHPGDGTHGNACFHAPVLLI